ncbi:MAG: ribonuclease P protein component [Candidatus Pacebacteria bacterium]|nr:ribonuclease P protein component [Candidatus Paceibacterota bacterium]
MIKKKNRLKIKEFQNLFKIGKKKHTTLFLIIIQEHQEYAKIGISIPKKIYKKAVIRNSIKRKIYNFLKKEKLINLKKHFLIIIKKKADYSNEENLNEIKKILI